MKTDNEGKEREKMLDTGNHKTIFPILLISIFLLISTMAFAIPNTLTLQGKLTNQAGASQQGTFTFMFRIYDIPGFSKYNLTQNITLANGSLTEANITYINYTNILWEQNQSVTTDANGVYDVILTGLNLSFAEQLYLGITIGSNDNESVPRINLTSSPYSFRANVSEALNVNNSYIVTNLSVTGNATIGTGGTTLEISTQTFNLTKIGNLNLANNISFGDAITFRFGQMVDNLISGWLKVTGSLNVSTNLSVANSLFVNSITGNVGIGTAFPNDKLTVAGNVNISGKLIANATYSFNNQPSYDPLDDGLVLYLPFSENANNISNSTYDRGPYGHDASLQNMNIGNASWIPSKTGYALGFDGIDDQVKVAHSPNLNLMGELTLAAWIRKMDVDLDNYAIIIGTETGNSGTYEFIFNPNDKLEFHYYGISDIVSPGTAIADTDWHHVAVSRSNSSTTWVYTFYVDGVVNGITTNTGELAARTVNTMIGNHVDANRAFNGTIDEVRIYKRALLSEEIKKLYLEGTNSSFNPYISPFGNIGINTTSPNYALQVQGGVNISNAIYTQNNGNVGIGTTSPYNTLVVIGSVGVSGSLNASSINTTGGASFATSGLGNVTFDTNTLFVDSTNNRIGIGNAQPNNTLDVSGDANITGKLSIGSLSVDSLSINSLNVSGETKLATSSGKVGINTTTPSQTLTVQGTLNVTNPGRTGDLFVASSGNVGIGTASPGRLLEVAGSINGTQLNISGAANLAYGTGSVGIGTHQPYNTLTVVGSVGISGSLNASSINTTGSAYFATSSGNVGIGTTSPTEKLHVIGSANVSDKIYSNASYSLSNQPSYSSFDDDLALYLPFSEGNESTGTTVYDRSKYGNNLNCAGVSSGCNWTSGNIGNALFLDGTDDVVSSSNPTELPHNSSARTVEAWIKPKSCGLGDGGIIVHYGNGGAAGQEFIVACANNIFTDGINIENNIAVSGGEIPPLNIWSHFVFTLSSNNWKYYLDGALKKSGTFSVDINTSLPNIINIGDRTDTPGVNFNGSIDEVRIYKRALSEAEVRAHYFAGMNATLKPYADSGGKVGINTSTPAATLSVNGTLLVNPLGTNAISVTSAGLVGIGTTAPQNKLEVIGSTTLAGGVNASSLNVTGFSITDDSLVTVVEFDEEENKKSLNQEETVLAEYVNSNNKYLNLSPTSGNNATVAQPGRAFASRANVLADVRVQNLNLDGSPGSGVSQSSNKDFSIKKIPIKDIKAGQYALSLDEATGKLVPRKVNALLDHGIKPIYEMATEDGRAINTTAEHPYFVKLYEQELCDKYNGNVWNKEPDEFNNGYCTRWVEIRELYIVQSLHSNPPSYTMNSLPLNSLTSAKREDNADVNFSTVGGWIKNTTIPQNSFGGNIALFRKSESLESKTKDVSLASEANLPFLAPLAAYSAESPLDSRNSLISILMFSSSRNFSEPDITFSADGLGSILQSVSDHFLREAGVTSNNAFYAFPGSNQFYNIANQNSGALESGLSMADFAVRNYELTDFDSHKTNNDYEIFKGFVTSVPKPSWRGYEIAVPDYSTGAIKWAKIASIKALEPQHVYDLSIEGTRNFIANDIVAHNTYLATSSGNVGIGTTSPTQKLTVIGSINATGNITSGTATIILDSTNNRIGIGTTQPSHALDVYGNASIKGNLSVDSNVSFDGSTFFADAENNKVGIGTTSPSEKLTVIGNTNISGYLNISGDLIVNNQFNVSASAGDASIANNLRLGSNATIAGKVNITGDLDVRGSSISLGDQTTDTIYAQGYFGTHVIPVDNARDLGSASNYWRFGFIDDLNVNNISAANIEIGGTSSATFTIHSNYTGDDDVDVNLVFERGSPIINAVLKWDSTNKRFDMNFPLYIQSENNLTVDTNTLFVNGNINKVGIGKTNPATELDVAGGINASTLNVSGNAYLATSSGNVGIGTTSPNYKLDVAGTINASGLLLTNGSTLFVNGSRVGIGTSTPAQLLTLNGGNFLQTINGSLTTMGGIDFGANTVNSIFVSGKYAYLGLSTGNEFTIVDISNRTSETSITVNNVSGIDIGVGVNEVFVSGKYAYLTTNIGGNEFLIVDISNVSAPKNVSGMDVATHLYGLYVSGKYAYISGNALTQPTNLDFKIIDVSNPFNPIEVGGVDTGSYDIYVSGRYAYAVNTGGFSIIDVSIPSAPVIVGTITTNGGVVVGEIFVSGRYAYVGSAAGTGKEFAIVDISDPTNPKNVSGLDFAVAVNDINVVGKYAYVSTAIGGLSTFAVVDVSNPLSPTIAATKTLGGNALNVVFVQGKYAYTGQSNSVDDFSIVELQGIDSPAATIGSLDTSYLTVQDNARIENNLYVGDSLSVGPNGILSQGPLSAASIGVNVSAPVQTLQVLGTVNITSAAGRSGDLFVSSAGFVGINTTSPTSKFHSIGTANITQGLTSFAVNSDRNIVIHLE